MSPHPTPTSHRREFLRATARYALLGAITAGAAAFTFGRRPGAGENCINRGICGQCRIFSGCELPPALSVKQQSRKIEL